MPRLDTQAAAEATAQLVGSEWTAVRLPRRPAPEILSADIVAETELGEPIVSVIHIEDRRHWNLVVRVDDDHPSPCWPPAGQCVTVKDYNLADALMGTDPTFPTVADGTQLHVVNTVTAGADWLVLVEVLEPAKR